MSRYLLVLLILFSLFKIALAGETTDQLTDPVTITVNATHCKMSKDSDLGVCILNKTGQDLNQQEVTLNQVVQNEDGAYTASSTFFYNHLKINHFLILETTAKRIKEGDIRNGISYATAEYFLKPYFEKKYDGCDFEWTPLTPPYITVPILVIEKNNDLFKCHFIKEQT